MRKELLSLLQAYNIPLNEWGVGKAKTFEHLLSELESGEAEIVESKVGLLRSSQGAILTVFYTDGISTWRLKEDRQVFKDGREKRRDLGNEMSIGEKMHREEDPVEAAYRALREELSITERVELHVKPHKTKGPVASESYPGLMTYYTMNVFEVFLPKHLYKPEGYIERQKDKTNYYVWIKV